MSTSPSAKSVTRARAADGSPRPCQTTNPDGGLSPGEATADGACTIRYRDAEPPLDSAERSHLVEAECSARPEKDRLRLTHEHLFRFVHRPSEGRASYFCDMEEVEPGRRDVVTVNARSGAHGHTATFPPDLIRPRILSSSPAGGVILDPFCGTGRALAISAENGRTAIGFEMAESFAEAAAQAMTVHADHGTGASGSGRWRP